jgi:hypothetical protein
MHCRRTCSGDFCGCFFGRDDDKNGGIVYSIQVAYRSVPADVCTNENEPRESTQVSRKKTDRKTRKEETPRQKIPIPNW